MKARTCIPILLSLSMMVALLIAGCADRSSDARAAKSQPASATPVTLHFNVTGMHCSGCEEAITETLSKLPGVSKCNASHVTKSVDLTTTDPSIAQQAIERIDDLGYSAELAPN